MKYDDPQAIWEGIEKCTQHQPLTNPDCATCSGEVEARSAAIGKMQEEATQILQSIAQQGGPPLPPTLVLEAKIEVLLDSLFTDPRQRLEYEGEVGRRVMLAIKNMQQVMKQPVLHVPNGVKKNHLRGL